ncbi:MAG: iron-sulfur cluster assembly scaffold protein [Planctomycetales bacterium]|nr:iron-sulfur cluster assembly scaffold protein [Planctomycetales bacterium]
MLDASSLLRDHYDDPYHRGPCDAPTHAACRCAAGCPCEVAYELHLEQDGTVAEAWFEAAGCPWCEALASLLCEYCEGKAEGQLLSLEQSQLLTILGLPVQPLPPTEQPTCTSLPLVALQDALRSPCAALDGDQTDGPHFGGPSLREEC